MLAGMPAIAAIMRCRPRHRPGGRDRHHRRGATGSQDMTTQVRSLQPARHPPAGDAHARDDLADQITARVLAILDARCHDAVTAAPGANDTLVFVICSFAPEM